PGSAERTPPNVPYPRGRGRERARRPRRPGAGSVLWLASSCQTEHDAVHSIPAEVPQQQTQTLRGALQVHVMPKARLCVHTNDSGLLGIDFPGMEVENRRFLVA